MKLKGIVSLFAAICLMINYFPVKGTAEEKTMYYFEGSVDTGRDNGFSKSIALDKGNPHFGWDLGRFFFTGYMAIDILESGEPVFYTKEGDLSFKLSFLLNYPIDKLNDTDNLRINEDTNGYDSQFGVPKMDFGYGALFIQRKDPESGKPDPVEKRLNFLHSRTAGVPFDITNSLQEGDYDLALDYEVEEHYGLLNAGRNWWNYKIPFSFKVRYVRDDNMESTVPENNGASDYTTTESADEKEMDKNKNSGNQGYKLVMSSEKLAKAIHMDVETDSGNVLTEYYYDEEHNATITLMAYENEERYMAPLIGEDETLRDFVKSIGEINHMIIPESEDCITFMYEQKEQMIFAKAKVFRTDHYISVAIIAKEGENNQMLFDSWLNSLQVYEPALETSMHASSHGVWEIWFGNALTIQKIFGDEMMLTSWTRFRHGFAAERANLLAGQIRSIFSGDRIKYEGGNNILNGPDFSIADVEGNIQYIQSKYYGSAQESIDACFDEAGNFRYLWNNKPMQIEVPKDQYEHAVQLMEDKINAGKIPGVSDPAEAKNLVREGTVTYKQAVNIAKAGTIDSLKYDSVHGCVAAASAFGVSAVVEFAVSCWQNEPVDIALKRSIFTGLRVGGSAFVVSVVSSQLSRTFINQAMIPAARSIVNALGPKAAATFVNAFRPAGTAIYGAAAKQAAAKLLRGNVITAVVTLVVFSVPDIIDAFRGRISGTQLAKNTGVAAGGIVVGLGGAWAGAAIGSAIAPGLGTVIGGIVGGIAGGVGGSTGSKAIADLIAEDDAKKMVDIISEEYSRIAQEYLLSQEEGDRVSVLLQNKIDGNFLKDMFASNDRHSFAASAIEPFIAEEGNNRVKVELPSVEDYTNALITVLEAIDDQIEEQ